MLAPSDDDGRICGYDDEVEDYGCLYFPDIDSASDIVGKHVCVKECPDADDNIDCVTTDDVTDCEDAAYTRYETYLYLGRFCKPVYDELPDNLKD